MISQTHIQTIKHLAQLFESNNISWKLVGSSNLALQGVEVTANDIDIYVKPEDISRVDSLLNSTYQINDIQIEVIAKLDTNSPITFVDLEGVKIPVPPLKDEYEAYLKFGKTEKAELIKKLL